LIDFAKFFSIFIPAFTNKEIKTTLMDSLTPNLFVRDMHATIDFYTYLGFSLTMTVPEPGKGPMVWAMMTAGNVTFMFQTFESIGQDLPSVRREDGGSLIFYIKVKRIRDLFARINGQVGVVHGLQKTFYGATEFSITDNNQYVLTFAEDEAE
jgi:uncharacterized glyoxalase superfamily protein PhnB